MSLNKKTPTTVFEHLQYADNASWEKFQNYYAPLIRYCGRECKLAPHEIELLVQNVMLAFFDASPRFVYDSSKGRFRTYLGRIIQNCIYKIIEERRRNNRNIDIDDVQIMVESELEKKINDDYRKFIFYQAFQEAKEILHPRMIQAFLFCELKHQLPEKVAKFLGVSLATVYNDKKRVLKELKRLVRILQEEDSPGGNKL